MTLSGPPPTSIVFPLSGQVARSQLVQLQAALHHVLAGRDIEVVICDTRGLAQADAVAVDALARLQLTAMRLGCTVVLRNASGELRDLIELAGLTQALR